MKINQPILNKPFYANGRQIGWLLSTKLSDGTVFTTFKMKPRHVKQQEPVTEVYQAPTVAPTPQPKQEDDMMLMARITQQARQDSKRKQQEWRTQMTKEHSDARMWAEVADWFGLGGKN